MQNGRMSKQIAASAVEGHGKEKRPYTGWRDDVKGDMNIMGIKKRKAIARDRKEWENILLEAKVHNGL
jgi:hypothetical protein